MTTIEEADVGILCFISERPGFRGILKQRYSDFIVNEVDLDGNVVHLTSFDAPPEKIEKMMTNNLDLVNEDHSSKIESFRSLAGEADAKSLKELLDQIGSGVASNISPIILSPDADKSHRTEVHNFFKSNFKFLVTDTVDGLDSSTKCVRLRFSSGAQHGRGWNSRKRKDRESNGASKAAISFDSRGSNDWPEGIGKFLGFHLYKENKDTQEALGVIGKMLGVQQRSFGFAGTKDKRSVSTQRVTIFKQHAKRLASLNDRLYGIKVGDFRYVHERLVLGQLVGNRFTITLRGVVADSEGMIKAAADGLGKNGFINYFGLQRFGSGSVPTHLIGAALLRGEWKAAAGLILDPREGERTVIREAREYYKESGDIDGTLRRLPRHLVAERSILQCLKKCPGNYLQALKAIPRTLRMMYVHSYQSYLWNHAASIRVQKFGIDRVVLGDLVCCKEVSSEKAMEAVDRDIKDDGIDENDYVGLAEVSEAAIPEEKIQVVKVVNDEEVHPGEYSFDDVVLPLPGSRVMYPTNDVADVYHDLAKKDGIDLTESVHNVKEFSITSMTGGYRKVFQRPVDYEWELLSYKDANVPLAETDLDIISKSTPYKIIEEEKLTEVNSCKDQVENVKVERTTLANNCEPEGRKEKRLSQLESLTGSGAHSSSQLENVNVKKTSLENNCEPEGEQEEGLPQLESVAGSDDHPLQKALKLGFTLPTSSYATMAIRELLKSSTSVAFQKTLNQ
ncbi:multisubstrate pseudouridine synthase 7 [Aristolochia californica]|uniref:multisubstrate pseudouridine synthase 7 n=1 Tax=Aristolochia californica TaxID=171875 RepID=UPI0035DB7E28